MNAKPFDINNWVGKKFVTREGHPARVLETTFADPDYPVVAAVMDPQSHTEKLWKLTAEGRNCLSTEEAFNSCIDLFEKPPEPERRRVKLWLVVSGDSALITMLPERNHDRILGSKRVELVEGEWADPDDAKEGR